MKNVVLFCLIAVLFGVSTSVDARFCMKDDDFVKFYVNGRSFRRVVPDNRAVAACHCIDLPPDTRLIAVEAFSGRQPNGVQTCDTVNPKLTHKWRCMPAASAAASKANWYQPSFNDASWTLARSFKCPKHCQRLPCTAKCYWHVSEQPQIRCRLHLSSVLSPAILSTQPTPKQLASTQPTQPTPMQETTASCVECCDGMGTNAVTGMQSCNRRCKVEVKTWDQTGDAADGYLKVTDAETNVVDTWTANTPGEYLATIDMTTCTITNKNYIQWIHDDQTINNLVVNDWFVSPSFVNVIAVLLAVGPSDPPSTPDVLISYAEYYAVYRFDGDLTHLFAYAIHGHGFSATLIGVQNGPLTISDYVNIP